MMNRRTSIGAAVVALVAPGAAAAVGGLGDRLDLLQDGVQLTIGPSCNTNRDRGEAVRSWEHREGIWVI